MSVECTEQSCLLSQIKISIGEPLRDYRMTRLTFGVSASSFIANMCVKHNALDFSLEFPLVAKAVSDSFYVDDGLIGADSVDEAIELHHQLQALFGRGNFLLRKWSSSGLEVLQYIDPELREQKSTCLISDPDDYAKTRGILHLTIFASLCQTFYHMKD